MSQHRISPEAGYVYSAVKLPGCRWCRGPIVESGRRTFCCDECVHQHKIRTQPGYVRTLLERRDHGVCRACGRDAEVLRDKIARWLGQPTSEHFARHRRRLGWLRRFKVPMGSGRWYGEAVSVYSLWQGDHIVPVVEGGGECDLEGYQTLCLCCHKRVTRELARRRAAARRAKPQASR